MEASARDQLVRHARALSGLRPAPPHFVYFVVSPPRRICRGARVYGKRGIWYNVCVNGDVYGTCEDEKIGGDAEAAAREGGDEAADEEGCLRTATAFT